jgi:hypothetical protein
MLDFIVPVSPRQIGVQGNRVQLTPGNPPGTAAGRALDRVLGTDLSGPGRNAPDGTPGNSGGAPRR